MVANMTFWNKPPPATAAQIDAWSQFFGVPMPADLRELLLTSNGPVLWDAALQKELQVLGAHEAEENYRAYCFNDTLPEAIPISMDGCGNFAFYIRRKDQILGVFCAGASVLGDPDETVFLCRSFLNLIDLERRIEDCL